MLIFGAPSPNNTKTEKLNKNNFVTQTNTPISLQRVSSYFGDKQVCFVGEIPRNLDERVNMMGSSFKGWKFDKKKKFLIKFLVSKIITRMKCFALSFNCTDQNFNSTV